MTNYICGTAAATTYELFLSPTGAEGTGTFKTPTGSFTATGTAVGGGSGTFNLGSTSTAITKGNLQTLSDDSSATTATATTASVKVVTVVSTTGAAQSSAFAAPIGVPGAIEVLGAAVMAVFGLF